MVVYSGLCTSIYRCRLHSCSVALQVWNEAKSDEEVLAMVVRTGLCTTMGTMLRQVMAPLNTLDLFRDPFITVSSVLAAVRRTF